MNTDTRLSELFHKPVAMMTGEDLFFLLTNSRSSQNNESIQQAPPKRMYYGIDGIAQIFGCSVPTANRIKKSGVIDDAITQVGRKIIIDGDMALAGERRMMTMKNGLANALVRL